MDAVRKRQLWWILTVFAVVLIADQVTKAIVMATITSNVRPEHGVFFQFTHQRNEGLVGGIFADVPGVALFAPLIATFILLYLYRHLNTASLIQAIAYGMVFGGALGNLVDRIRHGSVTDFIQFHFYFIPVDFPWKFYPAFNIADSCIVVGVALLVFTWHGNPPAETNAARTV